MVSVTYEVFTAEKVTDDMLAKAARLFNENYGTWGPLSHRPGEATQIRLRAHL